jgi:AraC family transcriptional regulator, exoenzyme S synthesis regulatory protein ExsA
LDRTEIAHLIKVPKLALGTDQHFPPLHLLTMRPVIQQLGESFIYSCTFDKAFTYEQFVPEHILAYQISGQTQIYHQRGEMVLEEGQILLAHRNQFAKSIKFPADNGEYQCLSVVLSNERLRQFALDNEISCEDKYQGSKNILVEPGALFKGYFLSLLPYVEEWKNVSKRLAGMKVDEAIELLLHAQPRLKSFLFDFTDPHKTDLEEFMQKNFHYNAPVQNFAKLSGRSLSGFKRDFAATFKSTPSMWLKNKRLSEAYYLMKQKNKRPQDIYLDLGFENLSHFYTSFKQKFGTTPAKINLKNK